MIAKLFTLPQKRFLLDLNQLKQAKLFLTTQKIAVEISAGKIYHRFVQT